MSDALDIKASELPVNTGIARADRETLAKRLNAVLATSYVLYTKTQFYHWNVAGPLFYSVHKLTEEQYEDLAEANDAIAERIRSIGFAANGGLSTFIKDSVIEDTNDIATAEIMVRTLAEDNQTLARQLREAAEEAEKADDIYTADLLTSRIGVHEEAAWMLNAIIAK